MEDTQRQDKVEAIVEICQYDRKIINALKAINENFAQGAEIPSEWWEKIMQGINWTVEVLKRVMDVLEEAPIKIDKQKINDALVSFDKAFTKGDRQELSRVIETSLIPCLEHICEVGEQF